MPEDSRVVRVGWDGESLGRAGRTNPSNQFAKQPGRLPWRLHPDRRQVLPIPAILMNTLES